MHCSYSKLFFPSGFGHENTWIGLNDRIVEQDFQWTDNTGLVSLVEEEIQSGLRQLFGMQVPGLSLTN